jgi:hypothetical protein
MTFKTFRTVTVTLETFQRLLLDHHSAADWTSGRTPSLTTRRLRCESDYADLRCPHCDLWIGDIDDPDISAVSVYHDIDVCDRLDTPREGDR